MHSLLREYFRYHYGRFWRIRLLWDRLTKPKPTHKMLRRYNGPRRG